MAAKVASSSQLLQSIRVLRNRVSWLERALKKTPEQALPEVSRSRNRAEEKARHSATMEYYRREKLAFYRRNPDYLQREIDSENHLNAFLQSRGIEPEPSTIPVEARRLLPAREKKPRQQPRRRSPRG